MNFIDVKWHHSNRSAPVRLVSELDAKRNETRKLEFFADGRVGYASERTSAHGTALGIEPVPPLEEINAQTEFEGTAINSTQFEQLWRIHGPHAQLRIQPDGEVPPI